MQQSYVAMIIHYFHIFNTHIIRVWQRAKKSDANSFIEDAMNLVEATFPTSIQKGQSQFFKPSSGRQQNPALILSPDPVMRVDGPSIRTQAITTIGNDWDQA